MESQLKNYLASHAGLKVTIDLAGIEIDVNTYSQTFKFSPPVVANMLASYSSFGPNAGDGAIKPEIVATGGMDVFLTPDSADSYLYPFAGLYMAAQKYDPLGLLFSNDGYAAADGTSFASPIVAGAAALVKQAHPKYTVAQIKSALVNTAAQDVTTDTFGSAVDVEWLGAGRLDAGLAANANVTLQVFDTPAPANAPATTTLNFGILKAGSSLPVTKQVQITNSGSASVTLAVAVATGTAATGATVTTDKTSVTVGAGATGTFNVILGGSVPKAGAYSGGVTLQGSGVSLRLPYLFLVGTGTASNFIPLFGSPDGNVGQDAGVVAVKMVDQYGVPAAGTPVTFTLSPRGTLTLRSVSGEPACSPDSSTTSVTCATDSYGVAYADMLLGTTPTSSVTVTARAAGSSNQFSGTIRSQPTISAGGIVDAAAGKSPIAPGSYISIYGNALSEYTDPVTYAPYALPLSLDGVTVSFDVPSAKLSVPGYLTYVSPGQVNVQVPWELQGQSSAQVKITLYGYSFGNVVTVPLADTRAGVLRKLRYRRRPRWQQRHRDYGESGEARPGGAVVHERPGSGDRRSGQRRIRLLHRPDAHQGRAAHGEYRRPAGAGLIQRTGAQFPRPLSGERHRPRRYLRGHRADFTDDQRGYHQGVHVACELEFSAQRGGAEARRPAQRKQE